MKPIFILLVICTITNISVQAQNKDRNYSIGKIYQLKSEQLQLDIQLYVKLPKNYHSLEKRSPVLLLLDGEENFIHAVSAIQSLSKWNHIPEMITVAVIIPKAERFKVFLNQSDQCIAALQTEIKHFINTNFKTSEEYLAFGWEITGGFLLEVLTKMPTLFEGYLLASPTPIFGAYFPSYQQQFHDLETAITKNTANDIFLYVTESKRDFPVHYGMQNLLNLLEDKAPDSFRWMYKKLNDNTHQTTPYNTIFLGLKNYYYNYPDFRVDNFDDFEKKGGLEYIKTYYKARKERFQFTDEENTKGLSLMRRSLVSAAISDNNYEQFHKIISHFERNVFWEELHLNKAFWYAKFYLKHGNIQKALEIFSFLQTKHPKSARPLHGIGDVYFELKDYIKAKEYYDKAVDLGMQTSDWRLEEYKKSQQKLKIK